MSDYGLSKQQLAVICALSSGATMTAAAQEAGVHRNTVNYWRRNLLPFQQALADAQHDRALFFREKIEERIDPAFKTLDEILADPQAPAGVRLKAALTIIQTSSTPLPPRKQAELEVEKIVTKPNATIVTEDQPAPSAESISENLQNLHKDAQSPQLTNKKVGRNEPCPCGSGKKYKTCCLGKPLVRPEFVQRLMDAPGPRWSGL